MVGNGGRERVTSQSHRGNRVAGKRLWAQVGLYPLTGGSATHICCREQGLSIPCSASWSLRLQLEVLPEGLLSRPAVASRALPGQNFRHKAGVRGAPLCSNVLSSPILQILLVNLFWVGGLDTCLLDDGLLLRRAEHTSSVLWKVS